jgi:hypothetical protein
MVLKKLSASLLLLLALLSGCGGGGDGNADPSPIAASIQLATSTQVAPVTVATPAVVNPFQTPAKLQSDKYRLAVIDYRFDTPADNKDIKGNHTTSFEAVRPMIDKSKAIGFTGILLTLQIPVNINTGLVAYYDQPPNVKTLPKDLWKVVEYAKNNDMQVWISLGMVDSITDGWAPIKFDKFSEQFLFNNLIEAEKSIAITAQKYKVDGIYVGGCSWGLESHEHVHYWKQLIDQVRTVFTGKLAYNTCIISDTPIWNYVDYVSVFLSSSLSKTPVYDLKTIVGLYNKDIHGVDEVAALKHLHKKYGKKLIIIAGIKKADSGVGIVPPGFWDMMFSGAWEKKEVHTDSRMYLLKTQAFIEMIHRGLPDIADGMVFNEFAPWLEEVRFAKPDNPVYIYYCCGWNLTHDLDVQKTLNYYFSKPWGHTTLQ